MSAIPLNTFFGWNNAYTYDKWDVVNGAGDSIYYYSTIASNLGNDPRARFVFSPTTSTRQNNVVRMSFIQTGSVYFQQGSVVVISGISPDSSVNYTGVVLAGGSGYVDYLSPGLNVTNGILAGGVTGPIHPYWTTGFWWIPSWTTQVTHNEQVISTQLGEGYSQRMNPVVNSNGLSWNMVFSERTDKETASLLNFLQVAGGVTPFTLPFPVGLLYNQPALKYITTPGSPPKHDLTSFGLNQITVPVTQVFDIG